MAELADRDKLEASLARELAKLAAPQVGKLIAALGDPPKLSNVSDSFWKDYGADLKAALSTALTKVYIQQAQGLVDQASADVNWDQINQDAADWASAYSFELVKGITDTTKESLQGIVKDAIEQSQPLEDVRAAIEPLFGPSRAATIATTELTRAASEGESAVVDTLKDQGVDMVGTWMTREDELVCPICGDLDGTEVDPDNLPPAHPNCRCSVGWEIAQ